MELGKLYDTGPKKFGLGIVGAGFAAATFLGVASSRGTEGPTLEQAEAQTVDADTTTTELNTTTTSTTVLETTSTAVESQQDVDELIENIYKGPETSFQCADEGVKTGVLELTESGEVIELLSSEMPVDRDTDSDNERRWSDAPSSPVIADRDNKEAVAREIYAAWCEQPDLLAAALVFEANLTIDTRVVGEDVDWLEEFVVPVEDIDEIADSLRLPHQDNQLTAEQLAENKAANDRRVMLAERLANAYYNKNNYGVREDASIESSIAFDPLSATYELDEAPEYVETSGYTGDVIEHGITTKIGDCAILLTGFNLDDKRPVIIIHSDNSCETPVDEPETTTSTTVASPTTTAPDTTTSVVPKEDDGVLPGNGDEAEQDPGTPDVAGEGEAGQDVSSDGTIASETLPPAQPTTTEATTTTTEAHEQNTATTGATPSTTNPPVVETAPTTEAQTAPLPDLNDLGL